MNVVVVRLLQVLSELPFLVPRCLSVPVPRCTFFTASEMMIKHRHSPSPTDMHQKFSENDVEFLSQLMDRREFLSQQFMEFLSQLMDRRESAILQ